MKPQLLDYLICPECKNSKNKLKLHIFVKAKPASNVPKEVKDGILLCSCARWFPIINFIPRMAIGEVKDIDNSFLNKYVKEFKDILNISFTDICKYMSSGELKQQVKDSFNYKWHTWPVSVYSKKLTKFFDEWFMHKLGLSTYKEFDKYFKKFNAVLDAGTGLGTKIETIAKRSSAQVIGVDLSGVEHAFNNVRKYPNAHVVQADIFNLPFKRRVFDFIVSDGVLHHTPDAKKAFYCLVPLLKGKGKISIHVYKKMGPIREFTDDYLRGIATQLSPKDCLEFCESFTALGKALHKKKVKITIPVDIDCLQIKKGKYDLQRFIYYTFFQCFWNPLSNFQENNLVNFDWFHPENASRHTEKEVLGWFRKLGFKKIYSYETNLSGISVIGIK